MKKVGCSETVNTRLNLELKTLLLEQHEDYLDYVKTEEESTVETFLNRQMEAYFAVLFEDVRYERSLILLLPLTDPETKQIY